MWIKLAAFAVYSLILISITWGVQNWRWESKQLAAVQVSEQFHIGEEKIANAADVKFQTEKGKTDATFKKIDDEVNKQGNKPGVICFDPVSLQLLNSALTRKAPAARRFADPMPRLASAK